MGINTVITAAHCFKNKKYWKYLVVAGLHNNTIRYGHVPGDVHRITEVKLNSVPQPHGALGNGDDVAILTVQPPFNFTTSKIQSVKLNYNSPPGLIDNGQITYVQ